MVNKREQNELRFESELAYQAKKRYHAEPCRGRRLRHAGGTLLNKPPLCLPALALNVIRHVYGLAHHSSSDLLLTLD